MKTTISLLFALLVGCAHTGAPPLPAAAAASLTRLQETPEDLGALVYRGRVAPLGFPPPAGRAEPSALASPVGRGSIPTPPGVAVDPARLALIPPWS